MPVPGRPRDAGGTETRFHRHGQDGVGDTRWHTDQLAGAPRWQERPHVFVAQLGRTPGIQDVELKTDVLGFGTIRRLWRQAVNYVPPGPPLSWTQNRPIAGPAVATGGITRALRYKTSSIFRGSGSMNTRFGAPRPFVVPRHIGPRVTASAGNLQGRPVLRNRLSSFGSRVRAVNQPDS